MKLEHEDITEAIIGSAYEVHNILGYEADLLVDGKVIVELKVAKQYNPKDEPQLLNELKATEIKVGLLINFGKKKVEFKRFIY